MGLRFAVRPVDLDESPRPGEEPRIYVERLAAEKASALAGADEVVLAADTIVVLDGELLGKPASPAHAEAMLAQLVGREHEVYTGVAVLAGESRGRAVGVERSLVRIGHLEPEEIAWYVGTGEPLDKAGSYAIQGLGAVFVEAVEGNYTNVVGLPLPLVRALFSSLGLDLLAFR